MDISSLNLLKDFDVDILKIDMKFLENLDSENKAGSIFTSVVRMAKWLNIPVVAEGVETREQLEFIRGVGCDRIQGYYFSKPLAMEDFDEHLQIGFDFDYDMLPKIKKEIELDELFNGSSMLTQLFNSFVGCIGIYEYSDRGIEVIRVNDRYYEVMGYNPQTLFLQGRNVLEKLYSEQDKEKLLDACERAVKGEHVDDVVLRRYHADGESVIWLLANIRLLGGEENSKILCFTANDITEQIKNEQIIEKQGRDLSNNYNIIQALYNNVLCGIVQFTVEEEPKLINVNNEACEILGYESKDRLYRNLEEEISGTDTVFGLQS